MNDPEKRTCPFCAEVIKVEAKVCPRCRQWLTLKSFRHPLVLALTHVVPMTAVWIILGAAWLSMMERLGNPRPHYSEFPGSLKILESRMNWAQTSDGLHIYITGVLTNTSPIAWKSTEFDCRFFDSKGVMVDADTRQGSVTISAYDDAAFRVSVVPIGPTNGYASFKISVGNARNARGLF